MCRPFRAPNIIIRLTQGGAGPGGPACPGLVCLALSGHLQLCSCGRCTTIGQLLVFWERFFRETYRQAATHSTPGSASLHLGLLMVPPLRGSGLGGLHPRFRFASPGVTHGAASTRLGAAFRPPVQRTSAAVHNVHPVHHVHNSRKAAKARRVTHKSPG